ncbi:MAG: phage tail tape measure protein [Candidatus Accumulibacter sp.]|jgi:TP901 family phage tail tape measure protein|nr:phage tail tape measure protein [Accumulibacter sp.]
MASTLALSIKFGAATGGALAALGSLKDSLSITSKAAQMLKDKQKGLNQTLREQIANKGPASYIAHLTRQYDEQARVIDKLAKKTGQLKTIKDQLKASESHRSDLRGKIMETAALGYAAARPVSIGVEFEYAMSKVQALTRLDKKSPEMKALEAQARELGASTMFSSTEAAQAQSFLAMAGFNPEQIMKSMPSMLDMAKAGDLDLQRTADIASNIQTAYGLSAEQMPRIADTLTMAFTTSNVSLEMLSQTMKYMGPVAKAAGMSLEEASAMAGLLGNAGIQADMAGTALRNTISRLAKPPRAAANALRELGVKTADAKGQLRPVPDILLDIAEKSKKLGSARRIGLFTGILGARAAPGLMAMLESPEKIKPYIDIVKNAEGAAAKTAKIMGNNSKGKIDELSSAWEDLNIALFKTSQARFDETLLSMAQLINAAKGFVERNPELVGAFLKIAAALIAFRAGLLVAQYGLSLLGLPFLQAASFILKMHSAFLVFKSAGFAAAFPQLAGFVKILTGALGFLKTAFIALKAVVIAHPVIAAIALIAAGAFLIWKNWDRVKPYLVDLGKILASPFLILWELGKIVLAGLSFLGGKLMEFFRSLGAKIGGAFSGGLMAIGAALLNWSPLGFLYQVFASILNWLGFNLPAKLSDVGRMLVDGLWSGFSSFFPNVAKKIEGMIGGLPAVIKKVLGIASPSRVFAEIGGYTMEGLEQGLTQNAAGPLEALRKHAGAIAAAGTLAFSAPALAMPPDASGSGFSEAGTIGNAPAGAITINVHPSPGMDEKALAELVAQKIAESQRLAAASRRSRLSDRD